MTKSTRLYSKSCWLTVPTGFANGTTSPQWRCRPTLIRRLSEGKQRVVGRRRDAPDNAVGPFSIFSAPVLDVPLQAAFEPDTERVEPVAL